MTDNLLITAIVPHPPIIIPEVGGNELKKVEKTINALEILSKKIAGLNPDTVVVITPHSVFNPYYFSVYSEKKLRGNFARFRTPQVSLEFDNDIGFIENLKGIKPAPPGTSLDHGSLVPLYYLDWAGYKNKVAVINYTALGREEHKIFGEKIVETAEKTGRKIALVASGDLSHKNDLQFDDLIVKSIIQGDYKQIEAITPGMRDTAAECGYNSLMVALGAIGSKPRENEVLSYEAPFGVGYVVGVL